jgi:hypothetical protein
MNGSQKDLAGGQPHLIKRFGAWTCRERNRKETPWKDLAGGRAHVIIKRSGASFRPVNVLGKELSGGMVAFPSSWKSGEE